MTSDTTPTMIDTGAPVISRRSLLIPAPRAAVWAAHADVARWPEWQSDISTASIDGPLAPGSIITWVTKGISEPIPSTIYAVEAERRTLWGAPAMGIDGIHEWRFTDAKGGTLVETEESWSGAPVDADPATMQGLLDASLDAWLARLADRLRAVNPPSNEDTTDGR